MFRAGHALNVPPDRKIEGAEIRGNGGYMFFCQKSTPASLRHACIDRAMWAGVPSCWNVKSLLCFSATCFIHGIKSFSENFLLVGRRKTKSDLEPNRRRSFTRACHSTEEHQRGRVFRFCNKLSSCGNILINF